MAECDKLLWQVIDEKTNIRNLLTQLHKFEYDTSDIRINEQEKANCAIDKDLSQVLKYTYKNPNFNIQEAKAYKAISNLSTEHSKPDEIFYKLLEENVKIKFYGKYFIVFLTEMLKIDINLFKNEIVDYSLNDQNKSFKTFNGNFIASHKSNKLSHISVINENPQITDYADNVLNLTFPSPAPTPTAQIISGMESPTYFGNGLPKFPNIDENCGGKCIHPLRDEKSGPPGLTNSTDFITGPTFTISENVFKKQDRSSTSPPRMKSTIDSCNVTPERLKKQNSYNKFKEGYYSESKLHAILKEKYDSLQEKSKKELELVTERYEAEKKLLQEQIYTFKTQLSRIEQINDFLMHQMTSLDTQTKIASDN